MDDYTQRSEELIRRLRFGDYLRKMRTEKKLSLADTGKFTGVSGNYLGEIERGVRSPSDELIRSLAKLFNHNENIFFKMLGRVPLIAQNELEGSSDLQETLVHIGRYFSNDQKNDVYKQFKELAESIIENPNKELFKRIDAEIELENKIYEN